MRKSFKKDRQNIEIIYAEPLSQELYSEMSSEFQKTSCIFFVTTLAFYEAYYEKLVKLLQDEQIYQWYICPNNLTVNSINSFQKIVKFIDETNIPTHTLIVGAGNQSIYHLCAFLKESSIYIDRFFFFSTTIKGFSESLSGQAFLCGDIPFFPVVKESVVPNYLIYSQLLNCLEDKMSWQEDFHSLMILGVSSDEELYKLLKGMKPTQNGVSLAPYLDKVIEIQGANQFDMELAVSAFQKGFYQLVESHYLTKNQKKYMAFLLFFLWCCHQNRIKFEFKPFFLWYEEMLKVNLALPSRMNTYDLAESISNELNRFTQITGIQSIGKSNLMQKPSLEELYQVIMAYRKIKESEV